MVVLLRMKVTNIAIIFVLVIFSMVLILNVRVDHLKNASYEQILMNRLIDTAVDDALFQVDNPMQFEKEKLQRDFYKSLLFNLEMPMDLESLKALENSTPVMILIENDGYQVLSHHIYINDHGFKASRFIWGEKYYFITYSDDQLYHYHLDGRVACYEIGRASNTDISDINHIDYEWRSFMSFSQNDQSKMKIQVTESIQKSINRAIGDYNTYLKRQGDNYQAYFPKSLGDHWANNLSKPGLLVFFQGRIFGSDSTFYNHFALGSGHIRKGENIIVIQNEKTNRKTYHNSDCEMLDHLQTSKFIYSSKFLAAETGAFPCEKCQ